MGPLDTLEDKILDSAIEDTRILEQYMAFKEASADESLACQSNVIFHALAVSNYLNEYGMGENYFHIGGYAVLFHVLDSIGFEAYTTWRGSHDLDLVATNYGVAEVIKGGFNGKQNNGNSVEGKAKIVIPNQGGCEDEIDIDVYIPNRNKVNIDGNIVDKRLLSDIKDIEILGINVRVPKLHDLMRMKLSVETSDGLPRPKDRSDIYNLLGTLERNPGFNEKYQSSFDKANYIVERLKDDPAVLKRLQGVVKSMRKTGNKEHVLSPPTTNLTYEISRILSEEVEK